MQPQEQANIIHAEAPPAFVNNLDVSHSALPKWLDRGVARYPKRMSADKGTGGQPRF